MSVVRPLALLVAVAAALAAAPAEAATRRALLVGIDDYGGTRPASPASPRAWSDLEGAVSDARAVETVLLSRLGFTRGEVTVLADREATRERLLAELRKLAAAGKGKGDVLFFYYAGHGSQVLNTRSKETDRLDETLVPADSRDGARDVSDKEIGAILEEAARRGAAVTVVLDSCHSGSATRGPSVARLRKLSPLLTVDHPDERQPRLAHAGALILSAAQDYQPASETRDEQGRAHGAFTASLLRALSAHPPGASAEAIFLAAREDMRVRGFYQEPVLEAPATRRTLPLLGEAVRGGSGRPLAAVADVDAAKREVTLRAGAITGVGPGSIFGRAGAPEGSRPRLVVTRAEFSTAVAVPEQGDTLDGIDATTVFELLLASPPREAALRVAVPASPPSLAESSAVAAALAPLRSDRAVVWVEDPARIVPTHTVLHDGARWVLVGPDGNARPLGPRPTAAEVKAAALAAGPGTSARRAPCDDRPCLAVRLPPPAELVRALTFGARPEDAIQRVARDADADYALYGRIPERGAPEFALVRLVSPPARCRRADGTVVAIGADQRDPARVCAGAGGRWLVENAPEPETLPLRTDFVPLVGDAKVTVAAIERLATRVARVSALLRLQAPASGEAWPYRLGVRRRGGSALSEGPLSAGAYELVLHADAEVSQALRRRVYVLVLQSDGKISVLFPAGNVENLFPPPLQEPRREYVLPIPVEVGPPYGVDTLLLVSSAEPLPGLTALEGEAVLSEPPERVVSPARTRGASASSALADLLVDAAARTRGVARAPAPAAAWGLERLKVVTTE